jgi:diguanylate cyclase (GGDEF)-like protein/PAS domain S-box-containing protein
MQRLFLNKISQLNNTILDSMELSNDRAIFKKLTLAGQKVLKADFAYSYIVNSDRHTFTLAYKSNTTPYEPQIPRPNGTMARTFAAHAPRLIENVKRDPAVRGDAKINMTSVAVIPVSYKDDQYGIMVLCFKKLHKFSREEQELCAIIGNGAAQAITINRLYTNLRNFRDTLDNTLDSIFIFEPMSLKMMYVNKGAMRLAHLPRQQILKKRLPEIITGLSEVQLRGKINEIIGKDSAQFSMFESYLESGGQRIPLEVSLQHVFQPGQPDRFLAIVRDISERKQSEETIRKMAYYDPLTGLPNRSLLNERLVLEFERASMKQGAFAVLFTDLDRFKVINDIFGHHAGDRLLKLVSSRLSKSLPRKATISRMGGDEFMILLPKVKDMKEVVAVATKIQSCFVDLFNVDGQEIYVNCSIGLSAYPFDGADVRSILKNADIALHRAKEQGGNNFQQYNASLPLFYSMQPMLERQLRQAIKRKEFFIEYQPLLNIRNKKIVSGEALIRWNHPEMGVLYPESFIGPAEESGLIVAIGEWLIEEVCRQTNEWRKAKRALVPISINVSPRELLRPSFVDHTVTTLRSYKIKPADIILELTETFLMRNIDLSVGILEQLKHLGFELIIDDFGTGYASLNYLKRLPIDGVKIDRSFIQGSTSSIQDAAITTAIITIAHQLGLKVSAEGVEKKSQLGLLKEHKCELVQGNLFYKPLSGGDFEKVLRKRGK